MLLRLLERARNVEEVEDLLLAAAVHPEGAGFARAHLLRYDPHADRLSEIRCAAGPGPAVSLADCVLLIRGSARPAMALIGHVAHGDGAENGTGNGAGNGGNGHPAPLSLATESLDGVCAAAWTRGGVAVGQADPAAELWAGAALGAVVLQRGARPHALLVGEWEGDERIAHRPVALDGLRQLAAVGLDALTRSAESRRRAGQIAAIAEFERAILSDLNLAEALRLALDVAARGVGARGGALWLTGAGGAARLEVTHGGGEREAIGRALQPLAEPVAAGGRTRMLENPHEDRTLSPEVAAAVTPLALLPLAAYGRPLGALAVYGRVLPHPSEAALDATDREFLELVADLAALAVDQARRFEAQRAGDQERRELKARARRQERMAALGEMAARLAEEVRNPLASIAAFARRAHRDVAPGDPHREYLEVVIREAERIDKRMREAFELHSPEPPMLRLESVNTLLQDTLKDAGETLVRRRIRLLKKLGTDLPSLLLDGQRMRRVLHNILERSLDLVAVGGRIRVESRRNGDVVVVEIAHDGLHRPGDLLDELFVPFRSPRPGSGTAGLSVAQQLVHEHGGEIRLKSDGEWNTVIAITLPVPSNQDRRKVGAERREIRRDRRAPKNGA